LKNLKKLKISIFIFSLSLFFIAGESLAQGVCRGSSVRLPLEFTKFETRKRATKKSKKKKKRSRWNLIITTVQGDTYYYEGLTRYSRVSIMTEYDNYREADGSAVLCIDEFGLVQNIDFSRNRTAYNLSKDEVGNKFVIIDGKNTCTVAKYDYLGFKPGIKLHCNGDTYVPLWDCRKPSECNFSKTLRDEYQEYLDDALLSIKGTKSVLVIPNLHLKDRLFNLQVSFGPFKVFKSLKDFHNFVTPQK